MDIPCRFTATSLAIVTWQLALLCCWATISTSTLTHLISQHLSLNSGIVGISHYPVGFVIICIFLLVEIEKGRFVNTSTSLLLCFWEAYGMGQRGISYSGVCFMALP